MKIGAVLDVLIHVVDHVFRKRRRKNAAIAKRAMPEFGAALAPGHNLVALKNLDAFGNQMLFARRVFVNDLAVVEHRLDLLRAEARTERQRFQRSATGFAAQFLTSEKPRAERRACVSRDGLHVNFVERAARLESAHKENIQKNAAGKTERSRAGLRLEAMRDVEHRLFQKKLSAARNRSLHSRISAKLFFVDFHLAEKLRRKRPALIGSRREVTAVENRKTMRVGAE